MKATKLLLAAALLTVTATFAFAGPGPQFWAQQAKNQPAQPAAVSSGTAKDSMTCGQCSCCASMKKA